MIIVSKDRKVILNLEQAVSLYISNDTIKAEALNKPWVMGRYDSDEEAVIAFKMLVDEMALNKNFMYFMPDKDAVKAKIVQNETQYRHLTGKKTKGHGGS